MFTLAATSTIFEEGVRRWLRETKLLGSLLIYVYIGLLNSLICRYGVVLLRYA